MLQLGAAGKVKVTVATDAPFAGVTAKFVGDDTVPPVFQMLRKGKATLDGLRPGMWEIESMVPDPDDADKKRTRTVEVVAGETVEVQL